MSRAYENITRYLKNHWTKYRLVCTHFGAFCMLMPNTGMKCIISEIFENLMKKIVCDDQVDVQIDGVKNE